MTHGASWSAEREVMESAAARIIGKSLEQVAYLLPETADPKDHLVISDTFDEVSVGVELALRGGTTFLCHWEMKGAQERLVFGAGDQQVVPTGLKRMDVSSTDHWTPLLGRSVSGVGMAWHVPDEQSGEVPWAVRLVLESSANVVFALGEGERPALESITYMPDSIVVIFDEATARGYEPLASSGSAYGGLVSGV